MIRSARFLSIVFVLALLSAWMAAPASAVDPQCQGVTQAPTVDVQSDGSLSVCFPTTDTSNAQLDPTVAIDVQVTAMNPIDGKAVTATASGLPGTYAANALTLVEADGTTKPRSLVDPTTGQVLGVDVSLAWKRTTEAAFGTPVKISVILPPNYGTGPVAPGVVLD